MTSNLSKSEKYRCLKRTFFDLINKKNNSEFIEIGRKGFNKTLSDKDIRNGIFFKLNLNNFDANLNKQFIRPVNYQCS